MKFTSKQVRSIYMGSASNNALNVYVDEEELLRYEEAIIQLKAEFSALKKMRSRKLV